MRYYIIAGEASGDLHGSNLMKGIYAEDPQTKIRFWGGDLMHEVFSRCQEDSEGGLVKHYKEGAIIGFVEVLVKARQLLGNVSFCKKDIEQWQPDVVILIDYPGFNFKIAEFAHKKGFKVFYYIAPKVWASREGRIKKLKAYVDKLFIVFPFEMPYFDSKGISYVYKGNPLVDAVDGSKAMLETRQDFLQRNNLEDKPVIAMLAGSRKGEISTMMPVLKEFAHKMHKLPQYSDYQFLIAGAPARSMEDYAKFLDSGDSFIKVLFGQTQAIIRHAEAAVVNSGGNLIIDRLAFKEFIQDDCNADALIAEVRELLENQAYRQRMLDDYAQIRSTLGGSGASSAVAKAMLEELAFGK